MTGNVSDSWIWYALMIITFVFCYPLLSVVSYWCREKNNQIRVIQDPKGNQVPSRTEGSAVHLYVTFVGLHLIESMIAASYLTWILPTFFLPSTPMIVKFFLRGGIQPIYFAFVLEVIGYRASLELKTKFGVNEVDSHFMMGPSCAVLPVFGRIMQVRRRTVGAKRQLVLLLMSPFSPRLRPLASRRDQRNQYRQLYFSRLVEQLQNSFKRTCC